jgi:hypothetical protein
MNENQNKKEQWFIFEVKNDDLAVVHRLTQTIQRTFNKKSKRPRTSSSLP